MMKSVHTVFLATLFFVTSYVACGEPKKLDASFYLQGTLYEPEDLGEPETKMMYAIVHKLGVEPVAYAVHMLNAQINIDLDENGLKPLHVALSGEYYDPNICLFLLHRGAHIDAAIMDLIHSNRVEKVISAFIMRRGFALFPPSKL